jgi:hypothetical protein
MGRHSLVVYSTEASQGRKTKTLLQGKLTSWTWEVLPKKLTTQSIIEKVPLLYFQKGGLSKCLKYFAHVLDRNGIPETRSFAFIHEVREVVEAIEREKNITNICEFQRKTPGHLQLTLSQWQQFDYGHLEPITWESQRDSILKGCSVAPYARSIFRDHAALVDGRFGSLCIASEGRC